MNKELKQIETNTFSKSKTRSNFKSVLSYFEEYCSFTSIHGIRYLGEERTIFERLWWLIIFIICLTACVLTILDVYDKWDKSPLIVSFATTPMPICDIPFPAVTVCSESKINPKIMNLSDVISRKIEQQELTKKEEAMLNYAASVCSYNLISEQNLSYNSIEPAEFFQAMEEVTPKFTPINCFYLGLPTPCKFLFTPIITDEGICYTFNMLDREELFKDNVVHYSNYHQMNETAKNWTVEEGYTKDAKLLTYPSRALLAGARYSFKFEIKTAKDEVDNLCRECIEGYRVIMHLPMRIPRPSQQFIRLPLDQAVVTSISPSMITTSSSVKAYLPKKRKCYFPSERNLKYFKVYSKVNCRIECLTNFTQNNCDCVAFYMPRDNQTKICTGNSWLCLLETEYIMQEMSLRKKLNKTFNSTFDCDCMPMCTNIDYRLGVSQTNWNWSEKVLQKHTDRNESYDQDKFRMSRFSIYFESGDFIASERNELYGPTDFLANFGGLLGLFTGFSLLSLVEIIYFLTVRLICNRQLYGSWTGSRN